jgi:hypothetical protein
MAGEQDLSAAKRRAAERLADLPGVQAVGVGSKEVDGRLTGEPAIKVFVRRKLPLDEIPAGERIPESVEGIPTDVVETGEIHPLAGPPGANRPDDFDHGDSARHRPLIGGSQLTTAGSSNTGTLGCFVWEQADHGKAYALTNFHVIQPPDLSAPTVGSTEVGQPSAGGSWTECCIGTIGKYAGGARVNQEGKLTDRDEALVRIDPGGRWQADIIGIGAGGADGAVRGVHPVTEDEANSGSYQVRKRGKRTRLTGGILSARVDSGSISDNVLVVNPNPAPSSGTSFFAVEGDSGSALLNDADEVVGLVYARDDAGHGFALMIGDVLSRLAADLGGGVVLEVATASSAGVVNTVPGATMVALPREVVATLAPGAPAAAGEPAAAPIPGWLLPVPPPQPGTLAHLERDLDRSRSGRRLVTLWLEHQGELVALVNTNRRIATTWHRSGAAALFQLLARMTVDPGVRLPDTVYGQPLSACIDRVHAMIARYASARLRRDLDEFRASLPDLAGRTYPQILDALGAS